MNSGQPARVERRLAAILAADVAGYSRLIGADEEGTLAALKAIRRELGDPKIAGHRGRVVKTTGDGLLVEFPSVVDAVRCAVEVQRGMAARNADVPVARRIEFRIGVNLGDVVIEEGDILGDGVNVAARLEALAEPGGICVSRVVRDQVRDRIDLAFEDLGERQLKNIARPVRVYRVQPKSPLPVPPPLAGEGSARSARVGAEPPLPLPEKPSLAVLPFHNMTGDPEHEYFVDGMVEEITTAIARLPWLFVIARNSSFAYKGKAVGVKQVARELGVRYVLEGSVRKAANRVRITGQLIDTATGAHIWADRFDGTLEDIFALQDQVASCVAAAIEPKLLRSEIERAVRKPTESLAAYDLYLRALAKYTATYDIAGGNAAIELLRRALAIDPSYAPAAAYIGHIRAGQTIFGARLSPDETTEALRLARLAIDRGEEDADVLWMASHAFSLLAGDHKTAADALERAVMLNPNSASAWAHTAALNCFLNRPDAAIAAVQRAMRLNPLDTRSVASFKWVMGYALMLAGRYGEAIEWVDHALFDRPNNHAAIRGRVALCGYLGRSEEAREWIARLLAVNPVHTIAWYKEFGARFLSPGTLAIWVEGFRRAGLPEG
jgi:adenylate cyclase